MAHLTPDTLMDLAEGRVNDVASQHVSACPRCERELAELRAVLSDLAVGAEVPEPSPLFWEHLSTRVHEAIASEVRPSPLGWLAIGGWRWTSLASLAAVVVVAALSPLLWHAAPSSSPAPGDAGFHLDVVDDPFASADDPSFNLLSDLAVDVDWTTADADAAGPITDAVVNGMTDDERAELGRLLREELGSESGRGGV